MWYNESNYHLGASLSFLWSQILFRGDASADSYNGICNKKTDDLPRQILKTRYPHSNALLLVFPLKLHYLQRKRDYCKQHKTTRQPLKSEIA